MRASNSSSTSARTKNRYTATASTIASTDGADDDQSTAGPASHAGDVLELQDSRRLPEDGTADAIALQQFRLRAEYDTFGPSEFGDVGDDPLGDVRRELVAVTRWRSPTNVSRSR